MSEAPFPDTWLAVGIMDKKKAILEEWVDVLLACLK